MKDSISLLSGVAASYATLPLSMLHQLQSVLTIEINNRLESFGEYSLGKSGVNLVDSVQGSVAEVGSKNVAGTVGNVQEKNVLFVNFGVNRSKV